MEQVVPHVAKNVCQTRYSLFFCAFSTVPHVEKCLLSVVHSVPSMEKMYVICGTICPICEKTCLECIALAPL
jgi:hypothetical protein